MGRGDKADWSVTMIENPKKSTRAELMAELDREWASIERICFSMTESDMVAQRAKSEWSVKDTLVHLSAWEKYLLDRLSYVMTGMTPQYPVMTTWEDVHHFNAQVYEQNKDRPLTSVVIEFRSLYKGVMTVLEALSDEQLTQAYSYDFPDDSLNLLQLIRANTCDHFREHCIAMGKDN
jgi:hypothetical protein